MRAGPRHRPSDLTMLSRFMGLFGALLRSINVFNEYAKCLLFFGKAAITKSESDIVREHIAHTVKVGNFHSLHRLCHSGFPSSQSVPHDIAKLAFTCSLSEFLLPLSTSFFRWQTFNNLKGAKKAILSEKVGQCNLSFTVLVVRPHCWRLTATSGLPYWLVLLTVSVSTGNELEPFYDLLARFTGFVLLASRATGKVKGGGERKGLIWDSNLANHIIQYYSMMTIAGCMDYPRQDLDRI